MRKAGAALAITVLLVSSQSARAADTGVIFQISTRSPASWKVAVHNVRNLERATGIAGNHIEIVVFSRASRMLLKGSPVAPNLDVLHASGVAIETCEAGLRKAGVEPSKILPFVHYVASGVAEIVRRERQGWAYVRP